jgi:hypothetical protein
MTRDDPVASLDEWERKPMRVVLLEHEFRPRPRDDGGGLHTRGSG